MSIERTLFCKCFDERFSEIYPKNFHRHRRRRRRRHEDDDDDDYGYYYDFLWKDDRIDRMRMRDKSREDGRPSSRVLIG